MLFKPTEYSITMKIKLQALIQNLNQDLIEREAILKIALLTVLAGENLVLIGPPGTGKSMIARRITDSLVEPIDSKVHGYFEYLLTKFSTPEEIFGPLSITELKADRFKRNTAGYLPTVQIAFLDEIFKASSSILNALLTILNERIYHNGTEVQHVPLRSLIAASNELPTEQEELSALYDRFLIRVFVDYVSDDNLHLFFNSTTQFEINKNDKINQDELKLLYSKAKSVTFTDQVKQAIQDIWTQHKAMFKEDRREHLSDRRLKKIIYLLSISAATNERTEVDLSDVFLLKDCLWNHQENAQKVNTLVLKVLQNYNQEATINNPAEMQIKKNKLPNHYSSASNIKGFKGNGSVTNPLIIETAEDLVNLESKKIGQQGFYFLQ